MRARLKRSHLVYLVPIKGSAYTLNTCKGKGKKIGNAATAQQLKPNNIHTQEKKQDNLERRIE